MIKRCRHFGIAALLAASVVASASPRTFANKVQNIRAGIVVLPSSVPAGSGAVIDPNLNLGQSAGPFALYNLDQARSIKPGGWNIYNPHAASVVTSTIYDRYRTIYGAGYADLPVVGSRITKRNQEYWNVYLGSASDSVLADYDLLVVNPRYYLSLNSAEREKLRKFVDRGGVLWVDPAGTMAPFASSSQFDETNNLPIAFRPILGGGGSAFADYSNPILTRPLRISTSDLNLLHTSGNMINSIGAITETDGIPDQFLPLYSQYFQLQYVVGFGANPTISVGRIGDGAIVVTARGASVQLNRVSGYDIFGNTSYTAREPNLEGDGIAAAKLAVNIISLLDDRRQEGGGSRKTNATAIDYGAPVLQQFAAEGATINPTAAPVIFKGIGFASVGNQLIAFDTVPGRDLDQDGDSDDGIGNNGGGVDDTLRDVSIGKTIDIIWRSPALPGPISAPTCAEVPDAADGRLRNQVLVTDAQGTVHIFSSALTNSGGHLIGGTVSEIAAVAPPGGAAVTDNSFPPQAPTISEGLAFVADNPTLGNSPLGRVWIIDLQSSQQLKTGTNGWRVGGNDVNGQPLPGFTSGATVGYIPIQDNSGGSDRVLYVPGVIGGAGNPTMVSIWLGARGEKPVYDIQAGKLVVTTRAAAASNLPVYLPTSTDNISNQRLGVKLTLLKSTGDPLTGASYSTLITGAPSAGPGQGEVSFALANPGLTKAQFDAQVSGVRIDYTIDWSWNPQDLTPVIERGRLQFPLPPGTSFSGTPIKKILGNIALSPRGTMHLVVSGGQGSNGSFYSIREDLGRGNFRVVSRYSLYSAHRINLNQGASRQYGSVLVDNDDIRNLVPPGPIRTAFNSPVKSYSFAGGPSLRGDQVFVNVNASKLGGPFPIPVTTVLAFKSEPELPELKIGSINDGLRIQQPDFDRSNDQTQPEFQSVIPIDGKTAVYSREAGVVRIENLSTVQRGQMQDCLSLSQPVAIGAEGQPYTFREPDRVGDRWSPLLWYCLFAGGTAANAPFVSGSTLFLAGSSSLPNILNSGTFGARGLIWAMNTDIATNGPFVVSDADRPWLLQVKQINGPSISNVSANPDIRMPQIFGATSFDDWRIRLNQSIIGNSTTAYGVAGGEGTLLAWGDQGVYGLTRADFIVCDEGRLLKVDSVGNATYASDAFQSSGPTGGGFVSTSKPLVRPTRAYPVGPGELLVVDTGGNRIVRLDESGSETRSIDGFFADPTVKPSGFQTNEPLTFNGPRDVLTYSGYAYKGATDLVTNQQAVEYWTHYLIADTGNRRLIEVIDRYAVDSAGRVGDPISLSMDNPRTEVYDVNGVPQLGVLLWQSPAAVSGKDFQYNSVSRVFLGQSAGTGRYVYVAGVGNAQPTLSGAGLDGPAVVRQPESRSGNGGVVIFDPNAPNGGVQVYNNYELPDLSATRFWDPQAGIFQANASRTARSAIPLSNVASVTTRVGANGGNARLSIMVTDANGVFEFSVDPTAANTTASLGTPTWMINRDAFTALRQVPNGANLAASSANPFRFRPTYARRLESGEVIVVNGYVGKYRRPAGATLTDDPQSADDYKGEVVMLDGDIDLANDPTNGKFDYAKDNLGFRLISIRFDLSILDSASGRGILAPVFADRR